MLKYKQYDNLIIANGKSTVLYPWINSSSDKWYNIYNGYHTGIDLTVANNKHVYSYSQGVVIQISPIATHQSVVIQYDAHICFRYAHLTSISVTVGQVVNAGQVIGIVNKFLHFEYLSTSRILPNESSKWAIRVGTMTYYKHNPELVLDGIISLSSNDWSQITQADVYYNTPLVLSSDMESEFNTKNRDD